jgi:hypothetical protein
VQQKKGRPLDLVPGASQGASATAGAREGEREGEGWADCAALEVADKGGHRLKCVCPWYTARPLYRTFRELDNLTTGCLPNEPLAVESAEIDRREKIPRFGDKHI